MKSRYIWVGPDDAEIPGCCIANNGAALPDNVPEDMIKSYVSQGLVKLEEIHVQKKLKEDR